ncbi:TonB C-terminal domain-containing protein [Sandaracinobacter neustonicus]|uniref:TonB C-terminal domain-containing protein n=1 Tax=Sandaracinobacter neustonicus TaxID=1715348 RepID=A0A501XIL5_9SPHN|nr:TonB C-terminal domain-containing protein [Sandaracinobacter neustonicus]TPE60472.1 TonB C-terminal domain-containing protein [Sandaracinobacter neustonicus]
MTEGRALLIAALLHVGLLLALSLGVAHSMRMTAEPDVTPVEFVDIADMAQVTTPPKPSMEAAPQDPEPLAAPEPMPEAPPAPKVPTPPVPQPTKVANDTAAQDAIAEAVAAAQPKKQPPVKAPVKPVAGQSAQLVDKSKPNAAKPRETSDLAKTIEDALPKQSRLSPIQAATLEQAIRAQIAPCWNPPIGGSDVADMTAVLRIRLNKDGSVAAPPEFVSQTGATAGNQAYARAFVETARRAVLRCAPLELPADLYSYWREFELNFDPRLMT